MDPNAYAAAYGGAMPQYTPEQMAAYHQAMQQLHMQQMQMEMQMQQQQQQEEMMRMQYEQQQQPSLLPAAPIDMSGSVAAPAPVHHGFQPVAASLLAPPPATTTTAAAPSAAAAAAIAMMMGAPERSSGTLAGPVVLPIEDFARAHLKLVQQCTLTHRDLVAYCAHPNFDAAVTAHGGVFIRFLDTVTDAKDHRSRSRSVAMQNPTGDVDVLEGNGNGSGDEEFDPMFASTPSFSNHPLNADDRQRLYSRNKTQADFGLGDFLGMSTQHKQHGSSSSNKPRLVKYRVARVTGVEVVPKPYLVHQLLADVVLHVDVPYQAEQHFSAGGIALNRVSNKPIAEEELYDYLATRFAAPRSLDELARFQREFPLGGGALVAAEWKRSVVNYVLSTTAEQKRMIERNEKLGRSKQNLAGALKAVINQLELRLQAEMENIAREEQARREKAAADGAGMSSAQRSRSQVVMGMADDGSQAGGGGGGGDDDDEAAGVGRKSSEILLNMSPLELAQHRAKELLDQLTAANQRFTEAIRHSSVRGGEITSGSGGLAHLTTINRERNNLLMLRGEKLRALRDQKAGEEVAADDNIWTLDADQRAFLADEFTSGNAEKAKAEEKKVVVQRDAEVEAAARAQRILERAKTQLAAQVSRQQSQIQQAASRQGSFASPLSKQSSDSFSSPQQQKQQQQLGSGEVEFLFGDDMFESLVRSATGAAAADAGNSSTGGGGGSIILQAPERKPSTTGGGSSVPQLFSYPKRREREESGNGYMNVANSGSFSANKLQQLQLAGAHFVPPGPEALDENLGGDARSSRSQSAIETDHSFSVSRSMGRVRSVGRPAKPGLFVPGMSSDN